ncbi:MAG: Endonuclease/exonuclease/phosphatase [Rhizobacter sp.]|nr:Endonuclease/exonuclease/phosphatase [Rhizobacter sp.]
MQFLFWNVHKQNALTALDELVNATGAKILILAENDRPSEEVVAALQVRCGHFVALPKLGCRAVDIFIDSSLGNPKSVCGSDRFSIWSFSRPGQLAFLLAAAHLRSKLYFSAHDKLLEACEFRQQIESAERAVGHQRTVIVGDLNMNPFDPGVTGAAALNAVSCRVIAAGKPRTVSNRQHPFFYNPSWNLLGDSDGNPGTYYDRPTGYVSDYWNVFDQVPVRPSLIERFDLKSMKVLKMAGEQALVSKGGKPKMSDHLPLTFKLRTSIEDNHDQHVACSI